MLNFSCISNYTYFDSPDFLILVLHIITTVSTPVYFLGIYCILFKTPEQMKSVKCNLFILHFWVTFFDYSTCLLTVPYIMLPEIAGISYGLLQYIGVPTSVQAVFLIVIIIYMIIAILSVYENRFFILCHFRFKEQWVQGRKVWLILHYVTISISLQILFLYIPDQESAKRKVFENLPCLPDYIYNAPVFVMLDNFLFLLILILIVVPIFVVEFVFFISQIVKNGHEQKKSMSQKTYQMHKQFFIAFLIQIIVPASMLMVPLFYSYAMIIFNHHNQAAMNCVVILFTIHGSVSTIVMVVVHRPYRQALRELIRSDKRMRKSTVVSVQLY